MTYNPQQVEFTKSKKLVKTVDRYGTENPLMSINGNWDIIDDALEQLTLTVGSGLFPERFPRLVGETDDSGMLQRVIDEASNTGVKKIQFTQPEYEIKNNTVNFKGGIWYQGEGIGGTKIKRTANIVAMSVKGDSWLSSNNPKTRNDIIRFDGIYFHGGDYTEDFMQLIACGLLEFNSCRWVAMMGRQILMQETMDSRFNNCIFQWGGNSSGTLPAIDLKSGSGYEYTNQVHFVGCRWESYRGTALATTGTNSNELFFTNCKFESLESNVAHLDLKTANAIYFDGVNVCSKGTVGNTIPAQIKINSTTGIMGTLFLEHTGTIDTTSAKIDRFVDIVGGANMDFYVYIYQNGNNTISPSAVMVDDTGDDYSTNIRGSIYSDNGTKSICNKPQKLRQSMIRSAVPYLQFIPSGIAGERWELGRVGADGAKSKFYFLHGETVIFDANATDDFTVRTNFFVTKGLHNAQLSTPPWGRDGTVYTDNSVNPACTRTYSNGAWRRVGYASSLAGVTGTWAVGDILYNTTVSEVGTSGSKYIIHGWRRATAGSANVLNTDWFEMRMLTGN